MNSTTLLRIFENDECTHHMFAGFGNPDVVLPKMVFFPSFVILNTDSWIGQGEHWCVIFVSKNKKCYFFDSFGKHPSTYKFMSILRTRCSLIRYNPYSVQGASAQTCGHHCIYFCLQLCAGWSPEQIFKSYSSSTRKNDNMVYEYVRKKYGDLAARIQ